MELVPALRFLRAGACRFGAGSMPYYRLYHLDPHTGHIEGAEDLFAADDVAAVHALQQGLTDHPLELWQEGRKVTRLDAGPELAAPGTPWPAST
jgi:hypothetical protein